MENQQESQVTRASTGQNNTEEQLLADTNTSFHNSIVSEQYQPRVDSQSLRIGSSEHREQQGEVEKRSSSEVIGERGQNGVGQNSGEMPANFQKDKEEPMDLEVGRESNFTENLEKLVANSS